jgi:ribosome-associated toxin RatA of RatAB toxin-antitoxin module
MNWIGRSSLVLLGFLAFSVPEKWAFAGPNEEQKRLMQKRDSERYKFDTPHGIRGGGARVTVKAPVDVTRKVVTRYKDYSDFIRKFEKSRIVGRHGDKTDVYLQVPILKGVGKIWAVLRFEPVKTVEGWDVIEGHLIKGNVKRLDAKWRIKKIDDENTQLNCEMVIIPSMPLPESVVVGEVAYAADVAVMGARDYAEKKAASK